MNQVSAVSAAPLYEKIEIGLLLAVLGGFLDAYTFLNYGGVFANTQTGNMVMLGISLLQGHFAHAYSYLLPILAFIVGVLLTEYLQQKLAQRTLFNNYHLVLWIELLLLFSLAQLQNHLADGVVTITISFICSLQINSFRRVCGSPFTSTMCTGNLRSSAEQLYQFLAHGNRQALQLSWRYGSVILCFCAGAAMSALSSRFWGIHSLYLGCVILLTLILLPLSHRWFNRHNQ